MSRVLLALGLLAIGFGGGLGIGLTTRRGLAIWQLDRGSCYRKVREPGCAGMGVV